jgi:hypothetical protein
LVLLAALSGVLGLLAWLLVWILALLPTLVALLVLLATLIRFVLVVCHFGLPCYRQVLKPAGRFAVPPQFATFFSALGSFGQ